MEHVTIIIILFIIIIMYFKIITIIIIMMSFAISTYGHEWNVCTGADSL